MTDKKIKKALECCDAFEWCGQCSLQGVTDCRTVLTDNALDLINRQQAEIEHLQGERDVMLEDLQFRTNQVIEQQAEIEKLERAISYLEGVCESTPDTIRAEAIKEYADILAEKFIVLFNLEYNQAENLRMIVKQMAKKWWVSRNDS